jgi:hypothetical protein
VFFHVDDQATGRQRQFKCEALSKRKAAVEASDVKAQPRKQFIPTSPDDFRDFILRDYWPAQRNHLTPSALEREEGTLNKHLGPYLPGHSAP